MDSEKVIRNVLLDLIIEYNCPAALKELREDDKFELRREDRFTLIRYLNRVLTNYGDRERHFALLQKLNFKPLEIEIAPEIIDNIVYNGLDKASDEYLTAVALNKVAINLIDKSIRQFTPDAWFKSNKGTIISSV